MDVTAADLNELSKGILSVIPPEELKRWANDPKNRLVAYRQDPVLFCEKELKDTYTEDIQKLCESVRDYPVTIAQSANAVGKSYAAAGIALWFYKSFAPDSQVYIASAPPESNLRSIIWSKIVAKITKNPDLFSDDSINDLKIQYLSDVVMKGSSARLKQESWIEGVTIPMQGSPEERVSKFSGKHAPYLLFILDEGDAIPDEVYQGIETCMSGGIIFRLLVMFNPKRMSGKAYQMIRKGEANVIKLSAFTHPNVVTGKNIIPGAVTREKTVQRINTMTIPLAEGEHPSTDCFEIPDFLIGAVALDNKRNPYPALPSGYRKVINNEFFYLVLGIYPTQGEHMLIPQEWIDAARIRWNQYTAAYGEKFDDGIKPICGQDVADEGGDSSVFIARAGNFVKRPKSWKFGDPTVTAEKAIEHCQDEKAAYINVDSGGVGAAVAPLIRKAHIRANRVMFNSAPTEKVKDKDRKARFKNMRSQLFWELRDWLKPGDNANIGAMLPPDDELLEELAVLTWEEKNDEIRVMEKDRIVKAIGRSPDKVSALILTFAPKEGRPRVRLIDATPRRVTRTTETDSKVAVEKRWID